MGSSCRLVKDRMAKNRLAKNPIGTNWYRMLINQIGIPTTNFAGNPQQGTRF
jgi:hypothetical protein